MEGNVILASNHGSEIDPLMLVFALPFFSNILPLAFVSLTKGSYKDNPRGLIYGGKFFELMGAYPAYSGLNDYGKSLRNHLLAIREGKSVCIFPVGKRHEPNDIKNARGGVSFLALETGLPIVPAKIEGLGGYKLKDYLRRKRKIVITFGEPLYANDIFDNSIDKKLLKSHTECEKAAVNLMKKINQL